MIYLIIQVITNNDQGNFMNPIRIGIIGSGGIVKTKHLPGFRKLKNCSLVGVCNRSTESSKRFAQENNIPKIFSSPEELIHSKDIDAVLIGTWPYKHCEFTLKSLNADKHVFVQARMAMNLEEAKKMLTVARAKPNLTTMICPSPFGFSADLTIRELMANNFVGQIISAKYTGLEKYDPEAKLTWRQLKEFSGLNIMGMGIYYETISRWIGYAKEVVAIKSQIVAERIDSSDNRLKKVEIEDDIILTGFLENGGAFSYHFGCSNYPPVELLEIFGTSGTIIFDFQTNSLKIGKRNEELKENIIPENKKKIWAVEEDFIDTIQTGKQHEVSFEEGLKYMAFTQAIHESGNYKKIISIAPLLT